MQAGYIFIITLVIVSAAVELRAQGCVAVRGGTMCGTNAGNTFNLKAGEFNVVTGARYFKSFRHFRGDHEEAYRVQQGSEVINHAGSIDLSLSYGITDRLFVSAIVPLAYNDRSSMYEHGGNPKFDSTGAVVGTWKGDRRLTSSAGLGDVRFSVGYWLFDPATSESNFSVALGAKLPTGKYDVVDDFYNQGPQKNLTVPGVVDQSIQLGDGGYGITADVQGIQTIGTDLVFLSNLYYMANVTNTNGVRQRTAAVSDAPDSAEFSSADQFGVRLGVMYGMFNGWTAYLGARAEGVPSTDIIGGSAGWRRPGYVLSIEPGIGYSTSSLSVFFSAPIAGYRNRVQNYIDKIRTQQRGVEVIGDAAFSDVLFNLSVSYRFGGSHSM
ncbi:MAG: transporter [Candidatus Kapabacteria bacterium]|nr:transporter [Candidatus Kapabacteria bacterium]